MSTCIQIKHFNPRVAEEKLRLEFEFCSSITASVENGFYWPHQLIKSKNLDDFRENLKKLCAKSQKAGYEYGKIVRVPQDYWWVLNEEKRIIGIAKTRYILTPELLRAGGHVGYALKEEYRGQGYGTELLRVLKRECKEHNLPDILVSAYEDNFASRRVIEKNGGQLWDVLDGNARYWIHLQGK